MLHQPGQAAQWKQQAETRRQAINKYLWNPTKGMFFDYDFTTGEQSTYVFATTFYPSGQAWRRRNRPRPSTRILPCSIARRTGQQHLRQRPAMGFALRLGSAELVSRPMAWRNMAT